MTIPLMHLLPPDAVLDLEKAQSRTLGNGVDRHYSGHDGKGLAFRFFIFDRYNKIKSLATKSPTNPSGIEIYDQIPMKETFVDKKTRLHEIVTDRMKYRFADEWARFEKGLEAPGTPLSKWGVVPSNDVMTLVKDGIFSVEQLALKPADYIQNKFPRSFFEYFTRAQQFVAAKEGKFEVEQNAAALVELQKNYALLQEQFNALMDERQMSAAQAPKKKSPGRPAKSKIITEESFANG